VNASKSAKPNGVNRTVKCFVWLQRKNKTAALEVYWYRISLNVC